LARHGVDLSIGPLQLNASADGNATAAARESRTGINEGGCTNALNHTKERMWYRTIA
jgi:hypothetical protein